MIEKPAEINKIIGADGKKPSKGSSNLKTILNQSVIMTIYGIASVGLGYVGNLVYTHYLTPDIFGDFTLSRTIVSFLPTVSLFGLHKGLLRQGSIALGREDEGLYKEIRNYTITMAMIISFTVGLITFVGADVIAGNIFNNPQIASQLRFFSFVIPAIVTSSMVLSLYQVNKKASTGQFLYSVLYFFLLPFIFLLFASFLKADALINWSFFIGHVIYFIFLLYYQKRLGYRFSLKINKSEKKSIYKISFPQFLSAAFNQSQKWSDTFLLGILGTSKQVGKYYLGLRIGVFISIPANAMSTIFMPIAARLIGQKKHDELNDLYKTVTRINFVCGSLCFGMVFFLRDFLVGLFGKGYGDTATIVPLLLISEAIDFGVGPARQLITMSGGGRINLINSIIVLTIDIVASYLLIPHYGMLGAAIANGITNVALQLLGVFELMFIYKLSPFNKQYFTAVGLFLACILGTIFLPLPDPAKLAIFLVSLGGLYMTIVLDKKERAKIKNLIAQKRKKKFRPGDDSTEV